TREVRIHSSIALLEELAQAHPVCIVSGADREHVDHGIELAGVAPLLAFSLSGDDFAPPKPDPTCYRMASEKLGRGPGECLVFEDSAAGVKAAKAAGAHCVALARPGRPPQDLSAADWVLDDLGRFSPAAYAHR
ncbi:MAG TPA: HAD family hydrolase, partial [Candidatus Hydrogenedentes bacterium]|nr:HAD family hydrolase [Candidatus Hydrogenedentota bacterium]